METYCGRIIAVGTGIVVCFGLVSGIGTRVFKGSIFSSLITVLLSQRMILSLSERRVNQIIAESRITRNYRNAAARIIQNTWKVAKWKKLLQRCHGTQTRSVVLHLRLAQRDLLRHVLEFRQCRWELRQKAEEEDGVVTIKRASSSYLPVLIMHF